MFLKIWNYLKGYVTLEVSGFSVERFINLAAHRGIYIWDVYPSGSKISMKMSVSGFKKLKGCTKKTKCKMRIVEKRGLRFLTFKYRKRKLFALGILAFILGLYFLSSFIWVIEITGNERIKTSSIVAYCDEIGLKPGVLKRTLNTKQMTNKFMTGFNDLSFVAIDLKGTKAKISIKETIKQPKVIDKTTPCDVYSNSAGIVTDVVVISGTPNIQPLDIVKKGDILVSGMLKIMDGEEIKGYHYTHAEAEVYAKVWHEIDLTENLAYTKKNYTDKSKKIYTVNLLKTKFNIINTGIPYKNYDKIVKKTSLNLGGDFALPISVDSAEYREYIPVLMERTYEETTELLLKKLDSILEKQLENDEVTVLDKEITFDERDGKVSLSALITLQKRIDEQVGVSEEKAREIENTPIEEATDNS